MSSAVPTIAPLTSLRFFAALHVVLLHNFYLSGYELPSFLARFVAVGHTSVTLFFILSGFILTYVYARNKEQVEKNSFWQKRFARIYPLFVVALLLDAPRVINYFLSTNDTPIAIIKILIAATANIFMIHAWIPQLSSAWNAPGWSLSAEAFFYFTFPFVILKTKNLSTRTFAKILAFLFAATIVIYIPFTIWFPANTDVASPWYSFATMNPLLHFAEFLTGILLAKWSFSPKKTNSLTEFLLQWGAWLGIIGILTISYMSEHIPKVIVHFPFIPFHALIIISLASQKSKFTKLFNWEPLVFLGNASFALYILHQPIKNYVFYTLGNVPSWNLFATYLIATLTISALTHLYIEEAARKKLVPTS